MRTVLFLALILTASCATDVGIPDMGALYSRAASDHGPERNPVILIPGLLGSKLSDIPTGTLVWGAFDGGYADPETPEGARLTAVPMGLGRPLAELRDGVESTGALSSVRVSFLGLPIQVDAYRRILASLGIAGYLDEGLDYGGVDYGDDHFTCFQFHYDWRRDNVENARRLHAFILEKRSYVREELKKRYGVDKDDIRFDIVAHSMGGLIARYYLRYGDADLPADGSVPPVTWAGAEYVERAILVATPNAGSAVALHNMVEGRTLGPTLPTYSPAVLGTFPALYQLLPRSRHGPLVERSDPDRKLDGVVDPAFWRARGWGLADPEQDSVLEWLLPDVRSSGDRRKIALDHQRKCLERAEQLHRALDTPAVPPPGLSIALMAGDAILTLSKLTVDRKTGRIDEAARAPGDGTVTRASALMDERLAGEWKSYLVSPVRWSQVFFIFAEHLDMTRDPAFTDNLLYYLLEHPR